MKTVHNVRVRAATLSEEETRSLLAHAVAMARKNADEELNIVLLDSEDKYVEGQLWLDRQQQVRTFVSNLRDALGVEACSYIRENPTRFLDTGSHCFILLDKDAFAEGKCVLATRADSLSIRLNIAAWPVRRENIIAVLQELFAL